MFKVTILTLFCSFLAGSDTGELKVIIERNVPVPMRDGTILRADVYRPDRGGPYPVLVQRTPYGKDGDFDRFVKAGYIVVSQDVRGRYESEGTFESFVRLKTHDSEDGYDTVEWAARLAGSNGNVGTFGISYDAFLQWRLAPLRPPSLKAISPCGIPARHFLQEMGGIIGGSVSWWVNIMAPEMRRRANRPGVHTIWEMQKLWDQGDGKRYNFLPKLGLPQEVCEDETEAFRFLLNNPHIDPWKLHEGCKDISVPSLEIIGWYDLALGNMLLHKTIVKEGKTDISRKQSRIIIGPWSHAAYDRNGFGPEARLDRIAVQTRWFDYWLKGIQNGVDKDAPVRIFVMGDNKWRDEQQWPLQRAKEKVFFITSGGHANTSSGDGKLVQQRSNQAGKDYYIYDPREPVPSLIKSIDRSPLNDRKDILVYETECLTERIEVTGDPIVELYASSTAPDTDWYVWLIDVFPDGQEREVSGGRIRARYRDGLDSPKLIRPGDIVKYIIQMESTSNAFLRGHRIRIDITSSDFPNYDRNHNTAADQNADATLMVADQTIYHGCEHATRIVLPWVPNPPEEEKVEQRTYPLHQAAAYGDIEHIRLLLSKEADINSLDDEMNTPLGNAVTAGRMEVVQILVEAGADVNAGKGLPLYQAVEINNTAIAEYLIDHGAHVNTPQGWTPLQQTPYIPNNIEMVKLLITRGADINAGPWTALHGSVGRGRKDLFELLIQSGADVNAKDSRGDTPLLYLLEKHDPDMTKLVMDKGIDIKPSIPKGLTSLHYISMFNSPDIVEWLLAKDAKVDERDDNYEFTALHYAARFGSTKVAEILIAHGADIRAKDKWGYEPIHWAAYHDRPEIIELLIAKGADVNAKTSLGQTPLELAIPRRNTATIEVLHKYSKDTDSDKPYVVLERGEVRAVIVNNEPVDDDVLPGHRGGYSGVASLTHRARDKNIFVPFYAGLNFEHIHDGTNQPRDILFEPRGAPMQIKRIDEYTAELYQPPTSHWQLESRLRYKLLEDGTIEMTLECIPHARTFKNDYIGLFFASYIDKPESLDIHFLGRPADQIDAEPRWIRGVTPEHGTLPTHLAVDDNRNFAHDPNFLLTLVFNRSNYRYTEPWYYGVSGGMAFVLMFRPGDNVRFSQSPSGAGTGNPAWDFQWFVPQYKVGQRYRFVMRAMYLPFESPQQIIRATTRHRAALE